MTAFERDASEVEALLTDRYLESVLARHGTDLGPADADLAPELRLASDRLRRDLVRVHPSFRFEERLAARLAEAAAALRLRTAAGGEAGPIMFAAPAAQDGAFDPLAFDDPTDERRELPRPLLIGGLTSAALSLAGAAFVAWRLARPGRAASPMVRAARAVRAARGGRDGRLASIGRFD